MERHASFLGKSLGTGIVVSGVLGATLALGQPYQRDLLVVPPQVEGKMEVAKKAIAVPVPEIPLRNPTLIPPAGADPVKNDLLRVTLLQYVPVLRSELRLLTSVSEPTPEQRQAIALESVRALKQVVKTQVESNTGQNRVVVVNGVRQVRRVVNTRTEPRTLIHEMVEIAARVKLSPEQFARFLQESQRKTQDRQEAVLVCIVAKLDGLLVLGHDQREKIQQLLRKQWDERSYPALELLDAYENYYPVLPDAQLNPILSTEQRQIWRNAQKINFATVRNNNMLNNGVVDLPGAEEPDADLRAALAQELKP